MVSSPELYSPVPPATPAIAGAPAKKNIALHAGIDGGCLKKNILLFLAVFLLALPVIAFSFGKNKVVYRKLEWQVLETNNFLVYYTIGSESPAREAALIAEGAYTRLSKRFKVIPEEKIKLFIYRNRIDFEQTNITSEIITEGVGGFTEPLKDRVVLPVFTNRDYFAHVIEHELTHRFQFEILYSGFGKSYKLVRSVLLPQWFMEGMADHEPFDEDKSVTDMLLRDAVTNNMTHPVDMLGGFSYSDGRNVVEMYKESKSFFDFIAEKYGEDKIGAIMREFYILSMTCDQALFNATGVTQDELNTKWQYWLKDKYWAQAVGRKRAGDFASPVTADTKQMQVHNTGAVFSPDGGKLFYISDRNNYQSIRCRELKTRSDYELIGYDFDSIAGAGGGLAVSPDGKHLAFAGKIAGKQMLRIFSTAGGSPIASFDCGLDAVYSPAFSGDRIIFAGEARGTSDLYSSRIDGSGLEQLTDDRYDDADPVPLDGGDSVVYVSRRGGKRVLVRLSGLLTGKKSEKVLTPASFDTINPCVVPGGKFLCSSDMNGIFDLYIFNPEAGSFLQVTSVSGGCFSPDFSVVSKNLVFSYYEQGCYNLYQMKYPEENLLKSVAPPDSKAPAEELPEVKFGNLISRKYEPALTPDVLFFLLGYDSSAGLMGGGITQASDLLGENSISIYGLDVNGLQTGITAAYQNTSGIPGFGLVFSSWRNFYAETASNGGPASYWIEDTALALPLYFPVDRFRRLEFFISAGVETKSYFDGIPGDQYVRPVNTIGAVWTEDRVSYNVTEPCSGSAFAAQIIHGDYVFGGAKRYTELDLERRDYICVNRETVLANRLYAGVSADTERGDFGLGGMLTLRGYPNNDMLGNNIFLWNLEARVTLIDNIDYGFPPSNWLLLKKIALGIFSDTGAAWDGYGLFPLSSLKNSVGIGLRVHVFPLMSTPVVLRLDLGRRTDTDSQGIFYVGVGHLF